MGVDAQKASKTLSARSIWLPLAIALIMVTLIIWQDDRITAESIGAMTKLPIATLFLAVLVLVLKDLFNMLRLRFLSSKEFGLTSVFYVVILWEFAIAVTPPIIGATAVLVFIMFKEGLSFGKALAYTMLAAMMDNLFFLTAGPQALWLSDGAVLPDNGDFNARFENGVSYFFYLSYGMVFFYTFFMASAILIMPKTIKRLVQALMSLRFLKRWQEPVLKQSDELILASRVLKGKRPGFWLGLLGLTYVFWAFKYGIVNVLIAGFVPLDLGGHLLILGRHLVLWLVMLVSPSPGNAGSAEFLFPVFYEDFLGNDTFAVSLIWRFLTYYPYLIFGALLLPKWGKRVMADPKPA